MANQLQNIAQTLQDPQNRQGLGQALGALGAGIQGNLPQFQQVQQQQEQMRLNQEQAQQEALVERQKTMFRDAEAALNLLDSGNLDQVVQLGMNRAALLRNFPDANPEDTQRLTKLAVAARNGDEEAEKLLRDELETTVEMGRAYGILERPERLSGSNLVEVTEPGTGRTVYRPADEAVGLSPPGGDRPTPYSDLAKIEADRRAGYLSDAAADLLTSQLNARDGEGTETEREIASLTQRLTDMGVENPADVAQDIARGYVEIEQLESGQVRLLDRLAAAAGRGDEAVTELPVRSLGETPERPEPSQTVYELADQAAGIVPFAGEVWGRIAGQAGAAVPKDLGEARQFVRGQQQNLIRALMQGRYTEGQAQRLQREIDMGPSVFDSPQEFRGRARANDEILRIRQRQEQIAAANPSLPQETREAAADAANSIQNYLDVLGVPPKITADQISTPEEMELVDPASIVRFAEESSVEEIADLPDDVRARMLEIVNGNR